MTTKPENSKFEIEKIPVTAGDVIFIRYEKKRRPIIEIFKGVIPI